jgi:hypothetical protein
MGWYFCQRTGKKLCSRAEVSAFIYVEGLENWIRGKAHFSGKDVFGLDAVVG